MFLSFVYGTAQFSLIAVAACRFEILELKIFLL